MGSRTTTIRIALAGALAMAAVALPAASADAAFHLMKVREVYPGSSSVGRDDAFIELQMFAAGQNFVGGHTVSYFTAGGSLLGSTTIDNNVPNGESQRTVLIGDTLVPGRDVANVQSDMLGQSLGTAGAGGAVCFEAIDCVSWGTFAGALPSPAGANAAAIPDGASLERSIAPNCATLLEDADDTNNSAVDFALATPSPRGNAVPPTETACTGGNPGGGPNTTITKGPKKKTKKKKATFEFSSDTPGATFECRVDDKPFQPCTSPFKVKVKKGKHSFEVRAVANGVPDGSPAEQNWKVKKRKGEARGRLS